MHILIINKQYERMKAALPIAHIQYLNQLMKVGHVPKSGKSRTCRTAGSPVHSIVKNCRTKLLLTLPHLIAVSWFLHCCSALHEQRPGSSEY